MTSLKKKLRRILRDKNARNETLKSMAVGILCTILDFTTMALIIYFALNKNGSFFDVFGSEQSSKSGADHTFLVVLATGAGFTLSFLINYVLSVFFVFRYGNVGRNKKGFLKFCIFAIIGFVITTLGQFIGYNLLEINLWAIKIFLVVAVFVYNYFTRRHYIFNILLIVDEEQQISL